MELFSCEITDQCLIPQQTAHSNLTCQSYCNTKQCCNGIEGPSWLYCYCELDTDKNRPQEIISQCSTCQKSSNDRITSNSSSCKCSEASCRPTSCTSCSCICSCTCPSNSNIHSTISSTASHCLDMPPNLKKSASSITSIGKRIKNKLKSKLSSNHLFANKSLSKDKKAKENSIDPNVKEKIDDLIECCTQEVGNIANKTNDRADVENSGIDCSNIQPVINEEKTNIEFNKTEDYIDEILDNVPNMILDYIIEEKMQNNMSSHANPLTLTSLSNDSSDIDTIRSQGDGSNIAKLGPSNKPCLFSVVLGLYKEDSWRANANEDLKQIFSDIDNKMSSDEIGCNDIIFYPKDQENIFQSESNYPDEEPEKSNVKRFPLKLKKEQYEQIKKHGKAEGDVDKTISKLRRWEVLLYKKLGFVKIVQ